MYDKIDSRNFKIHFEPMGLVGGKSVENLMALTEAAYSVSAIGSDSMIVHFLDFSDFDIEEILRTLPLRSLTISFFDLDKTIVKELECTLHPNPQILRSAFSWFAKEPTYCSLSVIFALDIPEEL